jgi:membrane protease YdiL (CAAX protease family)
VLWGLMIGLTEELYGRGLLVTLFGGRRRAELAIIGSSIGFAYLHLPTYASSYGLRYALLRSTASAAFSASGAVIRLRSGSIVGLIAFHAIDDTRMLLHDSTAAPTQEATEPEAGFVRSFVLGVLVTGAYWLACRREIRRATA